MNRDSLTFRHVLPEGARLTLTLSGATERTMQPADSVRVRTTVRTVDTCLVTAARVVRALDNPARTIRRSDEWEERLFRMVDEGSIHSEELPGTDQFRLSVREACSTGFKRLFRTFLRLVLRRLEARGIQLFNGDLEVSINVGSGESATELAG